MRAAPPVRYEHLCPGCHDRFERSAPLPEGAPCPRCGGHGVALSAQVIAGIRRPALTSLVRHRGGARWVGFCCGD